MSSLTAAPSPSCLLDSEPRGPSVRGWVRTALVLEELDTFSSDYRVAASNVSPF